MTKIEQGYVEQGYELPDGWTWDLVAEARARWNTGAIYVPLVNAPGCVGCGVPTHRDGTYFAHP